MLDIKQYTDTYCRRIGSTHINIYDKYVGDLMFGGLPKGFRPKVRAGVQGIPRCKGCEVEPQLCPQSYILQDVFTKKWLDLHPDGVPDARTSPEYLAYRIERFEQWGKRQGCFGRVYFETAMSELAALLQ